MDIHHRGTEFTESGVFLNQELVTPGRLGLRGEISESFFTTETQPGVATTKAVILISPQRHGVHRGFMHHDFLIRFPLRPRRLRGELSESFFTTEA